jgi:hypothetical protein
METAAQATTNRRSSYDSSFPYFLTASSRIPSHSNRNNTSFKNVRNPLSPNEKAFSNRNTKSLFSHSQPPSVKLTRHGRICELAESAVRGEL